MHKVLSCQFVVTILCSLSVSLNGTSSVPHVFHKQIILLGLGFALLSLIGNKTPEKNAQKKIEIITIINQNGKQFVTSLKPSIPLGRQFSHTNSLFNLP